MLQKKREVSGLILFFYSLHFIVLNLHYKTLPFNPISTGLFLHPICTGGGRGGKFTPYLKTVWSVIEVRFFVC